MSMNINICAERKAYARNKFGKRIQFADRRDFDCIQTPTKISNEIMAAGNTESRLAAYRAYVIENCSDTLQEPVYAEDDLFCEDSPVGMVERNYGDEHLRALDLFLKTCDEEGFKVDVYIM